MRGKCPRRKVKKRILSHKSDRSTRLPIKGDDTVFLPDELVTEVLSFSDVKFLMQMRCVCKSIISDPIFVKLHLKRSARNPHLTLYFERSILSRDFGALPFPVSCLIIENPSISLPSDPRYSLKDNDYEYVVGSCNGLLCLLGYKSGGGKMWFRLLNPAMHKMSPKLGYFRGGLISLKYKFKFAFGYDNSSETYKVVMLGLDNVQNITSAQVLNLRDDVWKPIQNFPAVLLPFWHTHPGVNDGVYLNGTFNWLALRSEFRPHLYDWKNTDVKDFVIVSFDLGTETYTQPMPPCGFDEMSPVEPSICILMDCLCFSNDYKKTDFVIWKMEEFGVEESWTQLIKVSYENLQSIRRGSVDLVLSRNIRELNLAKPHN
ncbi:putative F-box domain-containing protein [Medicago truncatula]|uniref:F-box protein interaction domain protein n=1 Tax=Medicago truncatula TaxID=3880 RepID=A0A072U1Q3_MEDTR|nr:F-box/kelch-repeat protein At3g23880 [Medicago truncatula]KEH23644.1 F-box protein interaction domain protein [Medicago truncatula]RHN47864.1 putative F-box domain-containing protein [Medicago truncatula]